MKIQILILTNRCVYWLDTIKKCVKSAGLFNKRNNEYFMEYELFKIEIKSQLRESCGQRYNAIVLDKYISDDTLSKIVMPQMSIRYTDCYFSDKEKEDCKNNKSEKWRITLGEFLETIALGEVTIFSQTTELATWKSNNSVKPEHFFSEKILNSKIEKIHGNEDGLSVLIDYKEDDE